MATKKPKPKEFGQLIPGSREWMNVFDQLPPDQQASILNAASSDPTTSASNQLNDFQDFQDFTDTGASPMMPAAAANMPMGTQDITMDPMYQQIAQMGGGVNIPAYSSSGKLLPYGITQEAQRHNLMQDQITSMADVIGAALAGPGALDPSSFQPDITMPTDKLATPGINLASRYAKGGGWQSFIADRILNKGMTDAEAQAELWDLIRKPDAEVAPEMKAARDEILRSLPPALNQSGQAAGTGSIGAQISNQIGADPNAPTDPLSKYDQITVNKFSNDLFGKISDDLAAQAAGYQDPQTGQWYTSQPTEEPSAIATKFRNLGLPTPFEQYTDPARMQQLMQSYDPNYDADAAAQQQQDQASQTNIDKLTRASDQASNYDLQIQALLQDPRNRPTPGGLRAPQPAVQAMNSVTQYMAPGAASAGTPYQGTTDTGRPTMLPGISQQDAASNIGNAQINAALTNMASQPNQPERPSINPIYTYNDALGQPQVGPEDQANQDVTRSNLLEAFFPADASKRGFGTQRPQRLTGASIAGVSKANQAARQAYENAYNADWNRRNNQLTDNQVANIAAIANANFAVSQGRTPLTDVFIQRLLGQRQRGVRGY